LTGGKIYSQRDKNGENLVPLTLKQKALLINEGLADTDLYSEPKGELAAGQNSTWQIAPHPLHLCEEDIQFFEELGGYLLQFYQASNRLYYQALKGTQPSWVVEWIDGGKDERVKEYSRLKRYRNTFPLVIRPDVIPLENGYAICELDSVPGGMGIQGSLAELYSQLGYPVIGGAEGMVSAFVRAMIDHSPVKVHPMVAIVVSDESMAYRNEMVWLAKAVEKRGLRIKVVHPKELHFTEEGLFLFYQGERVKIDLIYRFFELFDLKNIPKMDLMLYAVKKGLVAITPPLKHHLEEKMLMALFHHPVLQPFWREQLSEEAYNLLKKVFPETWVMDPSPVPPHAIIPGLFVGSRVVSRWDQLKNATQKERRLVIKPSGFSPLAWGSHGVKIGHDLSQQQWGEVIDQALAAFPGTVYLLQKFKNGKELTMPYYDFLVSEMKNMTGRARLCPYYLVTGDKIELAGILATICPLNKKLIHGMVDAIMVPCAR
jgi:hypothetical protein